MQTINMPQTLSIHELKKNYQSKKLTPEALCKEIVKRAESDKEFNIWITAPSMEIIQPYLERLNQMDPEQTPLWGIPFAIKDNIDLADVPTTAGCPDYSYTPTEHATVVKRLIEAGAIPIGKTNLDQFATGLVGTRSPYGETKNALSPDLISGGSSSGSAVSVARGLSAFSLGTDTAGSGRVPAALNRLVGLKTSLGAWPVKGLVPACASLDCITVFANSLSDALMVDEVVRGFEENDPWSRQVNRRTNALPEKILILKEEHEFFGPFAEEYRQAWESAVDRIKHLSIPIEYMDGSYLSEAASILYDGPWVAERWADLGSFINSNEKTVFPVTETVLRNGANPDYDAASVFKAIHKLQAFKQKAHQQLKNAVLIMPTSGGTWTREQVRENPIETNSKMGLYTNHCNLLDLCAIAVPCDDAAENLPFGITMFSSNVNEHLISGLSDLFLNGVRSSVNKATTLVAVCGLHMRGYALEKQMKGHGAVFVREAKTAGKYKMVKLPSLPPKPGLIRTNGSGVSIELELWEMPLSELGSFATLIPSPLGLGKVELEDGTEVLGFVCEAIAEEDAEDISYTGGWRYL
ncbi:allophanate hydrolase [Bacillus sp. AFS076308]|uniref:allophanate hydrolase n=1 Tax=unclassified Bacillus (in: firmicutes) TaxID=185979 RepID=UPI000BFA020B|nr:MULTISPECIES: allophanate hydrolase [unclassified Bacillus (in: firmicutes)]PFN81972.1 allophanate hydrolase [Bacillus sp. AFS076308]PGV45101.1 allophanate hydrolase [Bacillus sp. AFS037270]